MKNKVAAIAIILLGSIISYGQVNSASSKQPADWSLKIKTGGVPFEKKFEVELNQTGRLLVTEHDPGKMPGNPTTKLSVNLSATEAVEIYELALKAFREFRFAEKPDAVHDGTNLTLQLSTKGGMLVMHLFHIGQTEVESPGMAKVLLLINRHLPQEHQVY